MNKATIVPEVFWYHNLAPMGPALDKNAEADVVVIGAGMSGLSCAQKLREHGHSVIVLEKTFSGGGASGKSSGFITPDSELELSNLIANYGPEKAKRLWDFVVSGCDIIRKNIERYHLECDYQVQDSLFVANDERGLEHVKNEDSARKSLHYDSKYYSHEELAQVNGSKKYLAGVRYPDTFGINGYLYCQNMKKQLLEQGVQIYENTEVTSIAKDGVHTAQYFVKAKYIVAAADRFIPELKKMQKEIYHAQTFLTITKPLAESEIKKIFPTDKLMAWDTDVIYQYYRVTGDNRLLLGGAGLVHTYKRHETKYAPDIVSKLTRYLENKFPALNYEFEYFWPGLIGVTKDLLPLAGADKDQKNIFYVGAAAGLPWCAALGSYIAEKIVSGRGEFDADFNPYRKYPIEDPLHSILTTPITYAISHAIKKYLK